MNRSLCAALSGVLVALVGCVDDEPMDNQKKYRAWGENSFFADGRAMRPLPPHVVPREAPAGDGTSVPIPIPIDRALLERGRHKFEIYCATCHGLLGDGDSLVATNMPLRQPPSLHDQDPPDFVYRAITEGYGFMASYANELSEEERWGVIAYLQALKLSQNARLAALPPRLQEKFRKEVGP